MRCPCDACFVLNLCHNDGLQDLECVGLNVRMCACVSRKVMFAMHSLFVSLQGKSRAKLLRVALVCPVVLNLGHDSGLDSLSSCLSL